MQNFFEQFPLKGYEAFELSTQILIHEAFLRGLKVKVLDEKENIIEIASERKRHFFKQATYSDQDPMVSYFLMENKTVTKKILFSEGIRVPEGQAYYNLESALDDFFLYGGKEIIIKPNSTNYGIGVYYFKNEFSLSDFEEAVKHCLKESSKVIIEEFLPGSEYRLLVMKDEVVGVIKRIPAHVIGDGIHTIDWLVDEKNKDPRRKESYHSLLLKIKKGQEESWNLKLQNKNWQSIPQLNEMVLLRTNSNLSTGGESVDYTDFIHDSYKQIAIEAAKAVHVNVCGVDMIIQKGKESENASQNAYGIIELNFNPVIFMHVFPASGTGRMVQKKFLDLFEF